MASQLASSDGVQLAVREWLPQGGRLPLPRVVLVLVHQYSILGGCQALVKGLAMELNRRGFSCVTFDMRGVGGSTGRPTLTGQAEVRDVEKVCRWAAEKFQQKIVLVGSSAGAPIAGSAVDLVEAVVGYVGIGYTFGWWSSILFGSHYKAILSSPKPKLFIMGTSDGFTSVKQFKSKMSEIKHGKPKFDLVENVGHFELESPRFDAYLAAKTADFCEELERSLQIT